MQFMPFVTVEMWNLMVPIAEIVQVFSSKAEFAFGKTMARLLPGSDSSRYFSLSAIATVTYR